MNRLTLLLLLLLCGLTAPLRADEAEFVGRLALLVEPDVAATVGLSDEQLTKLREVIATREDAVLDIVLEINDLPAEERRQKLLPFVAESERLGLALLDDEQQVKFRQVQLRRQGLRALADADVVSELKIEGEQLAAVQKELASWTRELARVEPARYPLLNQVFEKKLSGLLNEEQRTAWSQLAGLGEAAPPVDPVGPVQPANPNIVKPVADGKLRFNFRHAPWKDVLDYFAQTADLSLVLDAPPPGTFNYTDNRTYTPAEAIDLLNGVLLTKGYTLVRRERMLMLVNLEDGVPPNLVPQISMAELNNTGEFELVSVLFQLDKLEPAEAEEMVQKLLGPQGSLVVLGKAKQIVVTETGGKIRRIRRVIDAVENPEAAGGTLQEFKLQHASPDEVLITIRQLLDLPDDQNAAPDGSLRIAVDPIGSRLIVTGKYDKIAKIGEILKLVDLPSGLDDGPRVIETPQMISYPIETADSESVLSVMQTLLAGLPDVRLARDPKTGTLLAYARPSQHATIRATLDEMQSDGKESEVIHLRTVDPQLAVVTINRLFGGGTEGNTNAPIVEAEPIARQLIIRGTKRQIAEIHLLLKKMGETPEEELVNVDRGNVRLLPYSGAQARMTLQQMEQIWPTLWQNRIKVVTPSAAIRTLSPNDDGEDNSSGPAPPALGPDGLPLDLFTPDGTVPDGVLPDQPPADTNQPPAEQPEEPTTDTQASVRRVPAQFAAYGGQQEPPGEPAQPPAIDQGRKGADIVVAPGPSGIVIASEDKAALDAFERMFEALSARASTEPEYTVFYLKYAQAEVASSLLNEILGGDSGGGGGGGGTLLGDIAGAALGGGGGGGGGGMLGSLLGLGGGGGGGSISTSGSFNIVAEPKLNALVVQANVEDLQLIEQLLKIIDQESSPIDVQTIARPRLIPVYNTSAAVVAETVRQVYAQQMAASAGGARQQPSPQELMRALRGGSGRQDNSRKAQEQQLKMTVSVDERSNSLVVSAPDPLFKDVEALVRQLDLAGLEAAETMQVVTLKRANPEVVQRALSSIAGESVQVNTSAASSNNGNNQGNGSGRPQGDNDFQRQIRERVELFNQLQRMGQQGQQQGQRPSGGRGPAGRPGGTPGGGRPGGFPGRGR